MKLALLLFFSASLISLKSSSQLLVDLSDKKNTTETIDIEKKKPVLIVKNLLPNQVKNKYSFDVQMQEEKIPAFSKNSLAGSDCKQEEGTKAFIDAYANINAAADESKIPDLQQKLEDAIKKLDDKFADCKEKGNQLLKTLTYTKDLSFSLRNNQTITVIVKRNFKTDDGKDSTVTWTKVFKTPEKTPWLIHFGFTYQPNIFSKYDQYYSKADTSNANKFTITKKNGNQSRFWENISPTIMFSYPFTNKQGDSHIAFSAMAATNFSNFSAGAGLSGIIGENVALGTGIMFTQKYVLNGQYKEGDIIKTNLTYDQLHEKKWGPEIYFTIAFRFDKNPFSGNSSGSGTSSAGSTGSASNTSTSH